MKKLIIFLMALAMVFNASAFQIVSPEHKTYDNTTVNLLINHTDPLDSIIYQLDNTQPVLACVNCSEYSTNLVLNEGTHTIKAWGEYNDSSYSDNVTFSVSLPEVPNDFSLEIKSPGQNGDYLSPVMLSILSNSTLDKIRYKIDDNPYQTACINCSHFNKNLSLEVGGHFITAKGDLDGEIKTVSTTFNVVEENTFSLQIIKPNSTTYPEGTIAFHVKSNTTLDRLQVAVGGNNRYCTDCSELTGNFNLSYGWYTLKATGKLDDVSKSVSVQFKVARNATPDDENETDDHENWKKFSTGFEKLPQMLTDGELTDAELAKILKENQLNPGIINRLIKTGLLGDESIDAILKYQTFMPKGIWMKMAGFFGYHHSYSDDIYKYYRSNKNVSKKLISQDDLPKGIAKKISKDLNEDINQELSKGKGKEGNNDNQNGNGKKQLSIGKEKPFNDSRFNGLGKTPPGQAKKMKEDASGNGKGKKD